MSFEEFFNWLSSHYSSEQVCRTLGGRSWFASTFSSRQKTLTIRRSTGMVGLINEYKTRLIFDRYWAAHPGDRHMTSYYTDPLWHDTPDRILAPYVAALIKEWANDQ